MKMPGFTAEICLSHRPSQTYVGAWRATAAGMVIPQGCFVNNVRRHIKCVADGVLGDDVCGMLFEVGRIACRLA